MKGIRTSLGQRGYHAFLLPVFFVFHHYITYYGLLSAENALQNLMYLLFLAVLIFFLFRLLTRHSDKSLQLTTLFSSFLLFFGSIKDAIAAVPGSAFITRYTVLLPVLLCVSILIAIRIARSTYFSKSNYFLNVLFLLFILVDVFSFWRVDSKRFLDRNLLVQQNALDSIKMVKSGRAPDIFYLVFDAYPGSVFLKEQLGYDNSAMDSLLRAKGFYVFKRPKSNYNRTAFSIASTLNFQYLSDIQEKKVVESRFYNRALLSVEHARVPQLLVRNGYQIKNLSIFKIGEQVPLRKENFLTSHSTWVIFYNTLPGRIMKDVLWNFITGAHPIEFLKRWSDSYTQIPRSELVRKRDFNDQVIDSLTRLVSIQSATPQFVYAHMYLPHPPFFYDSTGKRNELDSILTARSFWNKGLFFSYLKYTNSVVNKLIDTIQARSKTPPIIIIQSDHGFTDFEGSTPQEEHYFANYSAVFFPDGDYTSLYDSMSNVNTFPVVMNKCFGTQIRLLPDSVIFLPN